MASGWIFLDAGTLVFVCFVFINNKLFINIINIGTKIFGIQVQKCGVTLNLDRNIEILIRSHLLVS